jgi:hypothetical protein
MDAHGTGVCRQPIGVLFDADRVLATHEDGVSFDQIREQSYAGKYPPKTKPDLHLPQ